MIRELEKGNLQDGRAYRLLEVIPPGPEGGCGLFGVSPEWRIYYERALFAGHADLIEDHIFYAEVEGQIAARVWCGWSRRSPHGNFGNVYTDPAYRQKGLIRMLMPYCAECFLQSSAKMLCCSASGYRIPFYCKYGFHLIYPENPDYGPLSFLKGPETHFSQYEAKMYNDFSAACIRPGDVADQFDCDKFLVNTAPVHAQGPENAFVLAGDQIPDFQTAINRELAHSAWTAVLENANHAITGYAFTEKNSSGTAIFLNMLLHPGVCLEDGTKLAALALERCPEKQVYACLPACDIRRHDILAKLGFQLKLTLGNSQLFTR